MDRHRGSKQDGWTLLPGSITEPAASAPSVNERPVASDQTLDGTQLTTAATLPATNASETVRGAGRVMRSARGLPTFPELFKVDERGQLLIGPDGDFIPATVNRRELRLPTFHALRHGAAMDCEDAEEARDLLRHRNSNVTRAIYRAHFDDRRRELLRARMETRMETSAEMPPRREAG